MATKAATRSRNGADAIDSKVALRVLASVQRGDFSVRMPTDWSGSAGKVAAAINDIIESNQRVEREIRRLSRNVGKEGQVKRAAVGHSGGAWAATLDAVNDLVEDLAQPNTEIARVIGAVANGDLSQTMALEIDGRPLQGQFLTTAKTVNTMVGQLNAFASEVTRVAREVGTDGSLGGQADVRGVGGVWKDLTDNVNFLANNLTGQVRNIALVTTAVANGDLSKKITVDVKGEILELKNTINTMVDQLNSFASEVTRVAREVGTEGKLGGQADVHGVAGVWKNLTDNVNFMARNLTMQVRGISRVVTAVANGDLSQKLLVDAKGEVAALAETINDMTDTLGTFADQVSSVAREVGIEGKLGGQAKVPNATGTWRQLTDNVNQLAASLTTQIRAISEVATAVTKGDLARAITVEAEGEVASLKDNINQMLVNLRETTQKNQEQDWLKTNLAKFSSMMQGQKNLDNVSRLIMSQLTPLVSAHHGAFFMMDTEEQVLKLVATYAYKERKTLANRFKVGEGLVGQCALEKQALELEEKAKQLEEQNANIEVKNREVELARASLEEKAEQLSLISKYKSEFLANMSHELRTPLNSLLILAKLLADNKDGNLSDKQTEYAKTIYASGGDLLSLINEILDLSKVEAGKMQIEPRDIPLTDLKDFFDRNFRPVAEQKNLRFEIEVAEGAPTAIRTDPQRLQQVLKNLLANAFKFTEGGAVRLVMGVETDRRDLESET